MALRRMLLADVQKKDMWAYRPAVKSFENLGFITKEWGFLRGPEHDMLNPAVWRRVKHVIAAERIIATFLGVPGGLFSVIHTSICRPNGNMWEYGVQRIENARKSVEIGKGCMRRALNIIAMVNRLGVPWLFEHLRISRM